MNPLLGNILKGPIRSAHTNGKTDWEYCCPLLETPKTTIEELACGGLLHVTVVLLIKIAGIICEPKLQDKVVIFWNPVPLTVIKVPPVVIPISGVKLVSK
jgi:hypothetical protein